MRIRIGSINSLSCMMPILMGTTLRGRCGKRPSVCQNYAVEVIDLGLHLEDGLSLGLDTEEFTRKKALPDGLELDGDRARIL